jgi:ERCC4-related helicase
MAVPIQLRILALTATPGSKTQAIQGIIDNLQISTLEYRNESDHDVCPYVHDRKLEVIESRFPWVKMQMMYRNACFMLYVHMQSGLKTLGLI